MPFLIDDDGKAPVLLIPSSNSSSSSRSSKAWSYTSSYTISKRDSGETIELLVESLLIMGTTGVI